MEVIQVSGYDLQEKVEIGRQYLDGKARAAAGLDVGGERTPATLQVTDAAIEHLARWYCREAGVRNLEQHFEKIFRKVALEVVSGAEKPGGDWTVNADNLSDYVGKPRFTSDRHFAEPPPGVVPGLAYTSLGGVLLYIETKVIGREGGRGGDEFGDDGLDDAGDGGRGDASFRPPRVTTTGQLGDVMRESSQIAAAVASDKTVAFEPGNSFFNSGPTIHLHVPEGATPKDGPSAGVTMATALVGLALNRPIRPDVAMTGELTLTGKVLPVGGIREKVVAARRAGITCLVLPADNARDVDELPDYLKDEMEIHFASSFDDVFDIAFCEDRFFDL
jgi:Lon-like ATP-dependent protease